MVAERLVAERLVAEHLVAEPPGIHALARSIFKVICMSQCLINNVFNFSFIRSNFVTTKTLVNNFDDVQCAYFTFEC